MNFKKILKDNAEETFRYLICGLVTVCVNTGTFLLLSLWLSEMVANTAAFLTSTMFAYFSNTLFVFRKSISLDTFFRFWGMRIGTVFIDNGALYILLVLGTDKLLAKSVVNVFLIWLNYLFSKLVIYRGKEI